tara:strand:- start:240 stop:509 length:270 start_codon:yes stop_codon:yes gene_type:complete
MADTKKDTKAMEGFLKNLMKEKNRIKKKYPGAEGDAIIRELFVKKAPNPKAKDVKTLNANKGGMAKKYNMGGTAKKKMMGGGYAMKKKK